IPVTVLETRADEADRTLADAATMVAGFEAAHRKQFGFVFDGKAVVVESLEVEAVGGGADIDEPETDPVAGEPEPAERTRFYSDGAWHDAGVHLREALPVGATIAGAALIIEPHQTIVVEPGWQ